MGGPHLDTEFLYISMAVNFVALWLGYHGC